MIKQISLAGFMSHDEFTFNLPERGLVVVTAPNGRGKSALIEGVAWACWDRTLRGKPPWRSGEPCRVVLATERGVVERNRDARGKRSLKCWSADSPNAVEGDSATSTLAAWVGEFSVWRRTHVLSSTDADHFSGATDSERKELLESMLGLDFSDALEVCRRDLREAETTRGLGADLLQRLGRDGVSVERRRVDAESMLEVLQAKPQRETSAVVLSLDDAQAKASKLAKLLGAARKEAADLRGGLRSRDRAVNALDAAVRLAMAPVTKLGTAPNCPTCGQAISAEMRESLRADAERVAGEARQEQAEAVRYRAEVEATLAEAESDAAAIERRCSAAQAELGAATARTKAAPNAAAMHAAQEALRSAESDLADLTRRAAEAQSGADASTARVAVLHGAEQALGLRGVRAHVLGRALLGIEAACNRWLTILSDGELHVSLKPSTERKHGGSVDKIGLAVDGAGGGYYEGCSGGQRRRIDVAMLLGLAEINAAASGHSGGTLWLDEAMDCLDDAGVASVAEALEELSRDRAVVLITHSAALAELAGSNIVRL